MAREVQPVRKADSVEEPADSALAAFTRGFTNTLTYINKTHRSRHAAQVKPAAKKSRKIRFPIAGAEKLLLQERYQVCGDDVIGQGTFGKVLKGFDTKRRKDVAIKMVDNAQFSDNVRIESELIPMLHQQPHRGRNYIGEMWDVFTYKGFSCLVFEMLGDNLYSILKKNKFRGLNLKEVCTIAKHILQALELLALPSVNVVHCDLKPENILVRVPNQDRMKLIDFGSSRINDGQCQSYVQSRYYRAPEVLLGLKFSKAIDIWSLGCTLVELHTGHPLFGGDDRFDQMRLIEQLLGHFPRDMVEQASKEPRHCFHQAVNAEGSGEVMYEVRAPKKAYNTIVGGKVSDDRLSLWSVLATHKCVPGGIHARGPQDTYHTASNYELFVDLLSKMIRYHPEDRITPTEALNHAFFNMLRRRRGVAIASRHMRLRSDDAYERPSKARRVVERSR